MPSTLEEWSGHARGFPHLQYWQVLIHERL
jgi:hypothetical protein